MRTRIISVTRGALRGRFLKALTITAYLCLYHAEPLLEPCYASSFAR